MELDRDALLATFAAEADELLAQMETSLLQFESGDGADDSGETLLRATHTLKGNASCVSFDALTDYIHRAEDVLKVVAAARGGGSELITAVLRVVDVLRAASNGDLPSNADAVLAAAEQTAKRRAGFQPAHSGEEGSSSDSTREQSIRVATAKLDRMVDLAGELAIARGRVGKLVSARAESLDVALTEAIADADRLDAQLQELVMKLRMVPVGPELQRFTRMVRDVAVAHDKLAQLTIDGGDVEVDSAVVAALRDPLTHMLRNAIDHGIELPDDRERAGKPRVGTVAIRARHSAGRIVVEIEDDGAGLDKEKILARAADGHVLAEGERVEQLIFRHGFTTSDVASDLSGRGIGMDVVRRRVEALRGTIEVDSVAGRGTRFTIRLPLTLAIIDGFAVEVGDETFIVPLDSVVECVDLPPGLDTLREDGIIYVRGEALPFVRLRHHLQLTSVAPERESVVVVAHERGKIGLGSDRLLGQMQTVIKPLGFLDRVPGVSAAAILGSGDVALILDVPRIVESAIDHHLRRTVVA